MQRLSTPCKPNRDRGFTLIEVMVTVAVVAILAAIAVPSYRDYVIRGKVPEATSRLATRQVQLEQYFQDNRTYVGAPGCAAENPDNPYFDFSCTVQTATAFTLGAQGKNAMTGFTYTVTQANAKATTAVPSGWTAHSPNNCWVTKSGGIC
jgi:type IV pilus assembly protein PilE